MPGERARCSHDRPSRRPGDRKHDAKPATAEGRCAVSGLGLPWRRRSSWAASSASASSTCRPRSRSTVRSASSRWRLTTVGALALALLFAALSRRLPADGGPYAYARVAFGNPLGFANAWSYWITAWAGNAAIAVGWVLYVEEFVNTGPQPARSRSLLVLVGLWIPAAINLSGVKNMGSVQVVDDDPQVRRAGVHVDGRPLLHPPPRTTRPGTSAARARSPRSAAGWRSRCSATSASRPRPSPPPR